jgi:hypothetical protein
MTDPRFPRPVISGCRRLLPVLAVMLLLAGRGAEGAPVFGETVLLTQPDGARVTVRAWGDEYHQRLEDLAGYTLVRDPDDGRLCYARLTLAGDAFESTGVPAGAPVPAGLAPGLRLPGDVVAAKVLAAQQAAGRLPADGNKSDYPIPAVTGSVRGIALLVDFGDEPAVLTPEQVEAHLNEPGYSDFGNNGSVRDYYADVSGGRLDLTHEVTPFYYRAAHPKSYYEDPAISAGWRARELVTEALDYLNRRGFDFSGYDANGDGFVDLVSCFYAGAPGSGHGFGLWPQAGDVGFMADLPRDRSRSHAMAGSLRHRVRILGRGPLLPDEQPGRLPQPAAAVRTAEVPVGVDAECPAGWSHGGAGGAGGRQRRLPRAASGDLQRTLHPGEPATVRAG